MISAVPELSLLNETKIGAVLDLWFSFEEETLPTEKISCPFTKSLQADSGL